MERLSFAFAATALACSLYAQQQTAAPADVSAPATKDGPTQVPTVRGTAGDLHYRVRVVDGRSGMGIPKAHIRLWYDEPSGAGYELATDARGYANMPDPGGEPVRVLVTFIDYTDCRKVLRGDPLPGYSMGVIAKSGTVVANVCGPVALRSQPGELVLFARPQRWYEGLNRGAGN